MLAAGVNYRYRRSVLVKSHRGQYIDKAGMFSPIRPQYGFIQREGIMAHQLNSRVAPDTQTFSPHTTASLVTNVNKHIILASIRDSTSIPQQPDTIPISSTAYPTEKVGISSWNDFPIADTRSSDLLTGTLKQRDGTLAESSILSAQLG